VLDVFGAAGADSRLLGAPGESRGGSAVILFGPPGSGKGTQARLLRERCVKGPHISTGDMLRKHIEADDAIGREVHALMKSGRLVSDELVNRLVELRIQEPDCREGFILDGYPRTVNQATVLRGLLACNSFVPIVVHLLVDQDKVVARLSGRRQCPVCGTLYSQATNPPTIPGICDRDGAALITREDDREPVIRERLRQYARETQPILEYYQQAGVKMFEIEGGDASPEGIARTICERLGEHAWATP
jgi:adenylate kinase